MSGESASGTEDLLNDDIVVAHSPRQASFSDEVLKVVEDKMDVVIDILKALVSLAEQRMDRSIDHSPNNLSCVSKNAEEEETALSRCSMSTSLKFL